MKLLTFQASSFRWKTFSKTLDEMPDLDVEDGLDHTVVVFLHAEACDQPDERQSRVFRKTLKHIKWIANKRDIQHVVLHSFTHLGGENATPDFALRFLDELQERLQNTGYQVKQTPFGYFCSWQLDVYGDSLAKVWKEF
jgi:hypothetical protein